MEDTGTKFREWFWTIFGGTIISTLGVLLITVLNYLNTGIYNVKSENETALSAIREDLSKCNQKVAANEGKLEAYSKQQESQLSFLKDLKAQLGDIQKNITSIEVYKAKFDGFQQQIELLKDNIKEAKAKCESLQDKMTPKVEAPGATTAPKGK